jgi:hypothetical protein
MLTELSKWASELGGGWAKASFVVVVLLYVLGYLTIRFHLTAIGIGTDLSVLDERYLFAGVRFLVYMVTCIPSLVLLALPVLLLAWVLKRLCPRFIRDRILTMVHQPERLLILGILFAVFMIQFLMKQCFFLNNLLLVEQLPSDSPRWLLDLLIHQHWITLYFGILVAACGLSLSIAWALRRALFAPGLWTAARVLFLGLVALQILLLPINYGVFIVDKVMPRVAMLGTIPLKPGERAWLVWEGRDGITFLVQDNNQVQHKRGQRKLVTLARSDVKRLDILDYDPILSTLFRAKP